ncbi:hypothetical protein F5J12DRAFT_854098 [Pisolithus orientalis]|uniref:uncharacterized protein n=1 Tax=Pisolithus orientalis TaxID=936130 RepID=UPI002225888B|nr:uncharacterized protein F5J12DRAFT_854098 [Pisolithus orientalis]KAI5996515.1 hypothetical protein F5J12DRAFT_854098 [Pisolithus orientalis]
MPTTVSPTHDVLLYFLAIFVPPLAVFFSVYHLFVCKVPKLTTQFRRTRMHGG